MKDTPIASDDPLALTKLDERIAELEKTQAVMAAANKIVRKHKADRRPAISLLLALGLSEANAHRLFEPDYAGRVGFASYQLTNNNANIRRLKERRADIARHAADETKREELNGCTIIDNVEDFRIQIEFPGKPAENIRTFLKGRGFKWAPSLGVWQRHRGDMALYYARQAVAMLEAPEVTLAKQFEGCCAEFRASIYEIASRSGKTWQVVYALWRKYSDEVSGPGGQSALLSEFVKWNKATLSPDSLAGSESAEKTIWNSDGIDEPALICMPR